VGTWGGRYYRDVIAELGPIHDRASALFTRRAPGGEWFDEIAARLQAWLDEQDRSAASTLVITHGVTSRVLRGLLTGAAIRPDCGAPVAQSLPQGSVVEIVDGRENVLLRGDRVSPP
jgi:probable phosphoglycerate mutase